jgi:hypothetical protein
MIKTKARSSYHRNKSPFLISPNLAAPNPLNINKQTNRQQQTNKQTSKQTNNQSNKQTNKTRTSLIKTQERNEE